MMSLSVPFLLAGGDNLIPVWLLAISLQLISHMPLLLSFMPHDLYFYLREVLQLCRLRSNNVENSYETVVDDVVLNQAGYSALFESNLTGQMKVLIQVAGSLLLALFLLDQGLKWLQKLPKTRAVAKSCTQRLSALMAHIFVYIYLEVILCCLIQLRSESDSNKGVIAIFIIITLPFVALPLIYGFGFRKRISSYLAYEEESSCSESESEVSESPQKLTLKEGGEVEHDNEQGLSPIKEEKETPQKQINDSVTSEKDQNGTLNNSWIRREKRRQKLRDVEKSAKNGLLAESKMIQQADCAQYSLFCGRKPSISSLAFLTLIMIRALVFCFALIYIETFTYQVFTVIVTQLAYLSCLLHCHCSLWVDPTCRALCYLNEVAIFAFMVCQITFSAFMDDLTVRGQIGFVLLGLVNFAILVNVVRLLVTICLSVRLCLRRVFNRRRKPVSMKIAHKTLESELSES